MRYRGTTVIWRRWINIHCRDLQLTQLRILTLGSQDSWHPSGSIGERKLRYWFLYIQMKIPIWRSQRMMNPILDPFTWIRCISGWGAVAYKLPLNLKLWIMRDTYTICSCHLLHCLLLFLLMHQSIKANLLILIWDGQWYHNLLIVGVRRKEILKVISISPNLDTALWITTSLSISMLKISTWIHTNIK